MKKHKKKFNRDSFRQRMIITILIAASIMVFTISYMFKLLASDKVGAQIINDSWNYSDGKLGNGDTVSNNVIALVQDNELGNIKLWDLDREKHLSLNLKASSDIRDSHDKPISRHKIKKGSIVEVTYKIKNKDIISIQESPRAWEKEGISDISIDIDEKTIIIDKIQYDYDDQIIVINKELDQVDISFISDSDTLRIRGIDNQILFIEVLQTAGYLELYNIPIGRGEIEIGNNKMYSLGEIHDKIPLPAGEHKVVIYVEKYQPFVEHINIIEGKTHTIDLSQMEEIISSLDIKVVNTNADYKVRIDNKTYKKGETIYIRPGEYKLKIAAKGYKTLETQIKIKEGSQHLSINLEEKEEEVDSSIDKDSRPNVRPNIGYGSNASSGSSKNTGVNTNKDKNSNTTNKEEPVKDKTVQIIIETEPEGAQVFVNGVYKGTTPTLTGLKPGEYSISIEKEGYTTLHSTILIDESNEQKGFLYTLEKNQ